MWVFVSEGFSSIVTPDDVGHELHVRTRSKDDLVQRSVISHR